MLSYVPTRRDEMAGKKWLWIDVSDGERHMLMDDQDGVTLPEETVCFLASNVLRHPAHAS